MATTLDLEAGLFDRDAMLSERVYVADQEAQAFNAAGECDPAVWAERGCKCPECQEYLEDLMDDGDGPHMELQENMDFAQDGDFENYVPDEDSWLDGSYDE